MSLALITVLGAAFAYSNHRWLPDGWQIQWLRVDGPFRRVSAEQIRAAVAPYAEGGFFEVNLDYVQRAAERLPWVARAVVRKRWPDTLHIRVLEHRPVARWRKEAFIDAEGTLFQVPESGAIKGLPQLHGPAGRMADVFGRYRALRELLVGTGLTLRELTLTERGTWHMRVGQDIRIRLGSGDVAGRLKRFTAVYNDYFAPRARELKSIDLRYTNGFAVEWQSAGESGVPSPEPRAPKES